MYIILMSTLLLHDNICAHKINMHCIADGFDTVRPKYYFASCCQFQSYSTNWEQIIILLYVNIFIRYKKKIESCESLRFYNKDRHMI